MLGLNGVSLGAYFESRLGGLGTEFLEFKGFLPSLSISTVDVAIWIPVGFIIIWFFPNTQQWFAKYAPAYDEVTQTKLVWTLSRANAVIAGLILVFGILSLGKESDFLYFQF